MSLALEQPKLTPVQPWGCPRARDNFGTLLPLPEKTTCSFLIDFRGRPDPVLPFLAFLEFLDFFPCEEFLVFLSVFPFFSRDFGGAVGIKILVFWVVFLAFFQKSKERKDRGNPCFLVSESGEPVVGVLLIVMAVGSFLGMSVLLP